MACVQHALANAAIHWGMALKWLKTDVANPEGKKQAFEHKAKDKRKGKFILSSLLNQEHFAHISIGSKANSTP